MKNYKTTKIASKNSKGSAKNENAHDVKHPSEQPIQLTYKPTNEDWFSEEIQFMRLYYEFMIKKGVVDKGYIWAALILHTFIEGVFTQRPVPKVLEVKVPKGLFRITTVVKDGHITWLIRNDAFGCIAEAYPEKICEWAAKHYPNGIDTDGYLVLVHSLLSIGCSNEEEKRAIWNSMFFFGCDDAVPSKPQVDE